jgi:hypothetical protein
MSPARLRSRRALALAAWTPWLALAGVGLACALGARAALERANQDETLGFLRHVGSAADLARAAAGEPYLWSVVLGLASSGALLGALHARRARAFDPWRRRPRGRPRPARRALVLWALALLALVGAHLVARRGLGWRLDTSPSFR